MIINRNKKDYINLKTIPFSRFGSYFVVSSYEGDQGEDLYIRDIHGGDMDQGQVFKIDYADPVSLDACPYEVKFKGQTGGFKLIMPREDQVMIQTESSLLLTYKLQKYDHIHEKEENLYEVTSYRKERRYGLRVLEGQVSLDAPWDTIGNDHIQLKLAPGSLLALKMYKVDPCEGEDFPETYDQGLDLVKRAYEDWNQPGPSSYSQDLARYILWMNMVHPEGQLKQYAMYMTNNWMTNIWSWDNCFGAIYLAKDYPDLAYAQYSIFFDLQHATGAYPDYANDTYASYACVKPPIYGWAYDYMMRRNKVFEEKDKIQEVYESVKMNTNFWLTYRMREGLAYYTHGNDSGWDNGTAYMLQPPVAGPDLMALLSNQMDFLSRCCHRLGKADEGSEWMKKSKDFKERLVTRLYDGKQFRPYHFGRGDLLKQGDSLQAYLPILLGDLDETIYRGLVEDLKDPTRFNSNHGLATEAMTSPYYKENGYWRGPIWAPTMLMFIDGLRQGGYEAFAEDLALKYIKTLEEGGMAENHDPLTGQGLVDPAFAWTSSVYLTLLEEYGSKKDE